jgi:hypothetical protein
LQQAALEKERQQTEKAGRATLEDAKLLNSAGVAIGSADLSKKAESVETFAGELAALGKSWPPLTEPNKTQLAALAEISARIRSSDLANGGGSSLAEAKSLGEPSTLIIDPQSSIGVALHLIPEWQSPMEGIRDLHRFCRAKTIMVVATSLSSATETAALRHAMGSEYDLAFNAWQSELKRRAAVQEAIRQENERKREIEAERERQREQEMERVESHPDAVP